jgi:23S rRNA pseudouridine1911/1915/1917 synthase
VPHKEFKFTEESEKGKRLDVYLNECIGELSRAQVQSIIREQEVFVNSEIVHKPSHHLKYGDRIEVTYSLPDSVDIYPENIHLDIIYQDEHLAVINKPSGMVVHPGAGILKHTLVHALMWHFPEIEKVGPKERPGIVHRIDKEASGLLVIAKDLCVYENLKEQFKMRTVDKKYLALVWGHYVKKSGVISWSIGRHVKNGARMSIRTRNPKQAETHFKVLKTFKDFSFLEIKTLTGRTHQIRVHMSAAGHPIVGDKRYGRKKMKSSIAPRLFLHAYYLSFTHPEIHERQEFTVPLPNDLQAVLEKI